MEGQDRCHVTRGDGETVEVFSSRLPILQHYAADMAVLQGEVGCIRRLEPNIVEEDRAVKEVNMNKMIGFVIQPRGGGPMVVSVRRVGVEYKHKPYHRPTPSSMERLSHLTYQKEYKMTMTAIGPSFHLRRVFHGQV